MNDVLSDFFDENGYVVLRSVFSNQEIESFRQAADALIERASKPAVPSFLWGGDFITAEERAKLRVLGVHELQHHDAAFTRMLQSPVLLDAYARMIGENVELHHTKLIVKPPEHGGPFPWHQDYPYFPHKNHTLIAASIHLDDTSASNGCIRVVPGSHKRGPLQHTLSEDTFYLEDPGHSFDASISVEAGAGDVLFTHYMTVHGSSNNVSERIRRNILIQVRDPADEPLPEGRPWTPPGQGLMLLGVRDRYRALA